MLTQASCVTGTGEQHETDRLVYRRRLPAGDMGAVDGHDRLAPLNFGEMYEKGT